MSIEKPSSAQVVRLLADIGGTNARFALLKNKHEICDIFVYKCSDFSSFEHVVDAYLTRVGNPDIREVAIAIANPVVGDYINMTNSNWSFSIEKVRKQFGFDSLLFKNDFTALAGSIPYLSLQDVEQVGGGAAKQNTAIAVVGAGTGLGVSGLIPVDNRWVALQGEGGHVSMPASNQREAAIVDYCREHFNHVSAERLISGMGLINIYKALCFFEKITAKSLSAADITANALSSQCPLCRESLDIFCAMLGTVASDLALIFGARGGVYIGGGIVPRLGQYFHSSPFRQRFESKGRFSDFLKEIPVYVIKAKYPALVGIAREFT
jgi:glucokinase